jgi:hypothetical protein
MSNDEPQGAHGSSELRPPHLMGALRIGEVLPGAHGSDIIYPRPTPIIRHLNLTTDSGQIIVEALSRNPLLDYGLDITPPRFAEDTIYNAWSIGVDRQPLTDEERRMFDDLLVKLRSNPAP